MASPATPWTASKVKPRQSSSSNDLKKGKIDTLFKPKRIPLAELDINCFTPSPSQQAALQRNPGPWDPSPARPYLNRAATGIQLAPQSAPAPIRTAGRLLRTPTISEPRPPKRARLCDDNEFMDLPQQDNKIELGRSRFFGSKAAEPSPTVGKTSRRAKKEDITIFSDDSIEEALLNLPDFDGFNKHGPGAVKKISIFQEEEEKAIDTASQECIPVISSNAANDASTSQDSQDSNLGLTPSMSLTSSFGQALPTPTDVDFNQSAKLELKSRFAFNAGATSTPKSSIIVNGLTTPSSSIAPIPISSRPSRIPLAVKTNASVPKGSAFSAKSSLTPLQRLGANATSRSKLPMTPPMTPIYTTKSFGPRRSMLSKGSVPFPEVAIESKAQVFEPALIPLPIPDETENMELTQTGSEDLIVHDSEEEGLSPVTDDGPRIDFGRFVFAGKVRRKWSYRVVIDDSMLRCFRLCGHGEL